MKFEALLRAKCIELIGLWEGRLTTNRISDWFQVTRQAVSTDIKRYNETFNPDSLVHKPGVKAFVAKANMRPSLTSGSFNDYLKLVQLLEPGIFSEISELEGLHSNLDQQIFQSIHRAISLQTPVQIRHLTKSAPGHAQLNIIPVQLFITDGQPWVRVFNENKQCYRSVALSRIQSVASRKLESTAALPVDESWQQRVQLRIQPNSGLSAQHQLLIEQTHSMPMGHVLMRLPVAWVPFFLRSNRIAISEEQTLLADVFELQLWREDWPKIHTILEQESPWCEDKNL